MTSAGQVIKTPLPGGGKPNPVLRRLQPARRTSRDPENGQSVGSVITYGKFRAIDLGDLLWNNEGDLMCPNNPIGTIDLYLVSHHGTDPSGSPALVHALAPRVAVMQNGTRKGGTVQTFQTLHTSPGLEDIWQLHWAYNGGSEHNPPGVFIANIEDPQTMAAVLTAPRRSPAVVGEARRLVLRLVLPPPVLHLRVLRRQVLRRPGLRPLVLRPLHRLHPEAPLARGARRLAADVRAARVADVAVTPVRPT